MTGTKKYFTEAFDPYAIHGEAITTEVEGFTFTACIEPDYETSPMDYPDGWDADMVAAWKRDEWCFCTLVITTTKNGIALDATARLCGLDMNFPGSDNAYLTKVAEELVDEALPDARNALAETIRKLEEAR